jgi:hypothetical protein
MPEKEPWAAQVSTQAKNITFFPIKSSYKIDLLFWGARFHHLVKKIKLIA